VKQALSLAVVVILALTGCSGDKDFWGNPINTPEPPPKTCKVPGSDPLTDPVLRKPAGTPPDNRWITYELSVQAVNPVNRSTEFCVPIYVIYRRKVSDPDLLINGTMRSEEIIQGYATTPWRTYVSFDYDPTIERFQGRPPQYEIEMEANYLTEIDGFNKLTAMGFACTIRVGGVGVVQDLKTPRGEPVTCRAHISDNRFNSP
jgi:hypothetical protein